MIYNSVSSKEIVSKVITDLKLQEEDYMVSDMIEWIGEALDSIGAIRQYNVKVTGKEYEPILTVSNYQARLPSDLMKPVLIQYSKTIDGTYIPIKWNTNPIMMRGFETNTFATDSIAGENEIIYFTMDLMSLDFQAAVTLLNNDPAFKAKINSIIVSEDCWKSNISENDPDALSIKYTINNNYIKLNVEDGYIRMAYLSRPLDEDNYPLVPDLQSFRDALYWYVVMKIYYPKWALGRIRDRVYDHAEGKWRFFAKQAYAEGIMPDLGQLESMKDQWNKLFPELYEFDSSFSQLSEKQMFYNH